jgi:L-fuculokinase
MPQKVTAVFDIGKTNKKFFLFDHDYQEVYREYVRMEEVVDEDGFPTEDLEGLKKWLIDVINRALEVEEFQVEALNFSTYGASFVHLDEQGKVLTPLYNYMKPINDKVISSFYEKHGPENEFTQVTGSPKLGMLNSGLQLYWLKYTKPEIFEKIKYSLHLPQYLSYVFTGIPLSELTSIGCHTALWDYTKGDYHSWVYRENINEILAPIASTKSSIKVNYNGRQIKIGVGIHDSSSALIPFLKSSKKSFVLVSTGTWSVSMNPFSENLLTDQDILDGCVNYMRPNGKAIRSSRLLLGNEYEYQITQLEENFGTSSDYHKSMLFNRDIFDEISNNLEHCFRWKYMKNTSRPNEIALAEFTFEEAYHQLLTELIHLQIQSIEMAKGKNKPIKRVNIDGGFSDNDVFINILAHYLREMTVRSTSSSLGSALGAAIVISDGKLNSKLLKKNYLLRKHVPIILK